jgi:hypothetical protein
LGFKTPVFRQSSGIQAVIRCPVSHQSSNAFSEIAPTLRHLKDDYTLVMRPVSQVSKPASPLIQGHLEKFIFEQKETKGTKKTSLFFRQNEQNGRKLT